MSHHGHSQIYFVSNAQISKITLINFFREIWRKNSQEAYNEMDNLRKNKILLRIQQTSIQTNILMVLWTNT